MAVVLWIIDPGMAIATLALLPVSVGTMLVVSRVSLARYRVLRRLLGEFNAILADSIAGLPVLKSFGREREQLGKVRAKAAQVQEGIAAQLLVRDLPVTATETVSGLATALVLFVGVGRVRAGTLDLADLFVFVLYSLTFYRPFLELTTVFDRLQDSVTGAERVHALLETAPDIADAPGATAPTAPAWDVELRGVTFGYEPGTDVLRDVSFRIAQGGVTALVGPSGAGKSTIAALVARFYDAREGEVVVAGQDVRTLPLAFLRHNVAMVLQDVFLFHDTIRENIRFGRLEASDAEIEAAARAAQIHDLIVSLPDGYDTLAAQLVQHGTKMTPCFAISSSTVGSSCSLRPCSMASAPASIPVRTSAGVPSWSSPIDSSPYAAPIRSSCWATAASSRRAAMTRSWRGMGPTRPRIAPRRSRPTGRSPRRRSPGGTDPADA